MLNYKSINQLTWIWCLPWLTEQIPPMQTSLESEWHLVPSSTLSANWTTIASSLSRSVAILSSSSSSVITESSCSLITPLLSRLPAVLSWSFRLRRKRSRSLVVCTPRQIKEHGLVGSWCGYHFNSWPLYGTLSKDAHCSPRKSLGSLHSCNNSQDKTYN